MRTDKKISHNCVLVHFDSESNKVYARKPGKDNRNKYYGLITMQDGKIAIDKVIAAAYGLKIEIA